MSSSRAPVWVCVDQLSIAQVMSKRVGVRPPVEGGGEVTHTLENEFFPPFFLFPLSFSMDLVSCRSGRGGMSVVGRVLWACLAQNKRHMQLCHLRL